MFAVHKFFNTFQNLQGTPLSGMVPRDFELGF